MLWEAGALSLSNVGIYLNYLLYVGLSDSLGEDSL